MQTSAKTVSIWLQESINRDLLARGSNRSQTINRDISRLYALYRRALKDIRLYEKEASLIADALNGIALDADTANLLWATIEDSIELNSLDTKWSVDALPLIEKLKALSEIQSMAVIDAAETFWAAEDGARDENLLCKAFLIRGTSQGA